MPHRRWTTTPWSLSQPNLPPFPVETKATSESIITRLQKTKPLAEGPFFKLRRSGRSATIDTQGFWSYPAFIPFGQDSVLWLHLVLVTVPLPEKNLTALFRPKCAVLTKPGTCNVVRYENFRLSHDPFPTADWKKPQAMFPHQSVASLTYSQLQAKEEALLALYPQEQKFFLSEGRLSDEFRAAYLALIHPIFLPYLHPLAAKFVDALNIQDAPKS